MRGRGWDKAGATVSRAIETSGVTKYYGDTAGIVDLDLAVDVGEVFGFIGPNGAGKTTTIRLLLNFLKPSAGSGSIFGLDIEGDSLAIRGRVGYLPGDLALYPSMTGREFLFYFSGLRGIDTASTTTALAERFDLDLDRRIKEYSKGNRQKVGVVNAFMHEPELLILDEPTGGLDPLMQQEFAELLTEVRIPAAGGSSGFGFQEFARRHGDFALAGVAALISTDGSTITHAALGAFGGTHATRLPSAEAALVGADAGEGAFAAAGAAAAGDFPTTSDVHGTAEYRSHLVNVLTVRALAEAAGNAGGGNG